MPLKNIRLVKSRSVARSYSVPVPKNPPADPTGANPTSRQSVIFVAAILCSWCRSRQLTCAQRGTRSNPAIDDPVKLKDGTTTWSCSRPTPWRFLRRLTSGELAGSTWQDIIKPESFAVASHLVRLCRCGRPSAGILYGVSPLGHFLQGWRAGPLFCSPASSVPGRSTLNVAVKRGRSCAPRTIVKPPPLLVQPLVE